MLFGELKEGLAYIKRTPSIAFVLTMLALISFAGTAIQHFNTLYARDVLTEQHQLLGLLIALLAWVHFWGLYSWPRLRRGPT